MTSSEIQTKINELKSIRAEALKWRIGSTAIVALSVLACVWSLGNSVRNLFVAGPVQDQFTTRLSAGLKRDVLPNVQNIATQALTESKPEIEASFSKLNGRVPELTASTMKQFNLLQKNIPERGDKVLSATYGTMLKSHEAKIHEMFPEATDANIATLVDNMTTEGNKQIVAANTALFAKHMTAMNAIQADMTKIQETETISPDQDKTNWETALTVVDSFHDDLAGLKTADTKAPAKVGTGAKQ